MSTSASADALSALFQVAALCAACVENLAYEKWTWGRRPDEVEAYVAERQVPGLSVGLVGGAVGGLRH